MAEIIRLGSLLLDGNHAHHWSRYRGRKISFGDTTPKSSWLLVRSFAPVCHGARWTSKDSSLAALSVLTESHTSAVPSRSV